MILIDKLRAATQPMHEELDKTMVPYIMNIHSVDDFIKLLCSFYGFFKPIYEKIDAYIDTAFLPDYNTRRKPVAILQNLTALHYHQEINNYSRHLPYITENAGAFGALYVMEGSTLGGLIIKKMVADKLSLPDAQLSFFAGYGKQTKERWNLFVQALNGLTDNANEEQKVVKAAVETFSCFKDWLPLSYF